MNISVAMPYYMRQAQLDRSLAAYRRHYSGLELSICDDGSPDPVSAPGCIVTRLPEKDSVLNPCVPANVAVRASSREIVCLTNPEIEHRQPVFAQMLAMLTDPMDYVAARCWDVDLNRLHVGPGVLPVESRRKLPPGAYFHMCALMHRSLFELVGGFDEDYRDRYGWEDTDFLWKLHEVGATFKLCEDAMVYHYQSSKGGRPATNEALCRERWGHLWR